MKNIVLFLIFCFSSICIGEERIRMLDAPEGRKEMEELMDKASISCNERNFSEFMSCFTKKKASSIRRNMKELFSRHELEMQIISLNILSGDEKSKEFDMTYSWDSNIAPQKLIITAKVIAKKEENNWKIDFEEVRDVRKIDKNQQGNLNINFGGAGQVEMNPVNNDDFLPRDIAKRPGGCANGQCNVR
jgi:hypothetical protein